MLLQAKIANLEERCACVCACACVRVCACGCACTKYDYEQGSDWLTALVLIFSGTYLIIDLSIQTCMVACMFGEGGGLHLE